MGFKVVFTPQALADLRDIAAFIAHDSPDRALDFSSILIDTAESIGEFPNLGRTLPETADPSVREIIHGSYRIIYEVFSDVSAVYILRFWHAARGIPRISGP